MKKACMTHVLQLSPATPLSCWERAR